MALGEANVSVAGEYALTEELELTNRAVQLFANEVGVMAVYPYLRKAVAAITGRVFNERLHLQIISRGDIVIDGLSGLRAQDLTQHERRTQGARGPSDPSPTVRARWPS